MDSRLLCWMALCLLGSGHTEPGVSQTPSHQVTEMGQGVILRCDPISGHIFLYWYRQNLRQEMEFLLSFQYQNIAVESAMPKERFSAERPNGTSSTLKIRPAEPGDSAVYLCARSSGTAPLSPFPPAYKPSAFSPLP
uniref:T cell receptor beta variable 17 (non-functional) n=1 Tax=Prolemur simus TaxID=1328070 RepID=A0A8C8YBS5_PROSS